MADNEKNDSGPDALSRAASAANHLKGAVKTGKAAAGAAKGAAGPFGWALLAIENRKVIANVLIVMTAFLLLPVIILEMLPGVLFDGFGTNEEKNNETVEKAVFDDITVIMENFDSASRVVDEVMSSAHDSAVRKAYQDFASYGPDDEMLIIDDTSTDPYDAGMIVCDYSAVTDFNNEINPDTMREKLEEGSDKYYYLTISEEPGTKERRILQQDSSYAIVSYPYVTVTYTVTYIR